MKKITDRKNTGSKKRQKKSASPKNSSSKNNSSKNGTKNPAKKNTRSNGNGGRVSSSKKEKAVVNQLFPIVAIGASAGGLEAYSVLLDNLPTDTGMAYVIVQHLHPKHKSLLKEILSREVSMKVVTVEHNQKPQPDTIYVMPQNVIMKIEGGIFKVYKRPVNDRNMPIDIFMRSLAEDHTHYAIGVILSGTDSDGVLGLEYIKTTGGITFAQDRRTAKFNDMPRNAVNAGAVDFVLPPPAIARELVRISRNPYLKVSRHNTPEMLIPGENGEVPQIHNILHSHCGIDFRDYKPTTVKRRILRRMVMHKISHIRDYVKFLKKNHLEIDNLCEDILINVTSFFRDPEMYEALKARVFPNILEGKDRNTPVRIWVTACSTGEEAYSMAIAIMEYLEENRLRIPVQVFSTDLSDTGIEKARSGIYSEDIKNDVSQDRLRKYFVRVDGKYQINKVIRDMCVFAKQNLVQDPPFSKIDLISCRNVLIYLGQVLQNKLMPIFHYATSPGGFLVLGTSETVGNFTNLFEPVDKKNKIFRKKSHNVKFDLDFNLVKPYIPATPLPQNKGLKKSILKESFSSDDFRKMVDSLILSKYAPASVLVNSDMEIIQFRGKTGDFLELPQGEPTFNLLRIAKNGLPMEIRNLLKKITKDDVPVRKDNIELNRNGSTKFINVIINPISRFIKNLERLYLVVFEESAPKAELSTPVKENLKETKKIQQLKNELAASKDNLQSIIEELESANEELRAANEEIQSSNEELQSTNEELETAKEELQSTNEELTTVNEEMQNRNQELSVVNSDLNNLLGSINIPIVMLDTRLRIRRYTSIAERLLNIIPSDIGRRLTDITNNLELPDMEFMIQEVLDTPTVKEMQVKDKNNCWYSMRIRPYLTSENKIDGVIIIFIEITDLRNSMKEIEKGKTEIASLNSTLENRVKDRTKEISIANKTLEAEIKERKSAEESLKLLSKHLVNAQENERHRLSRELHDGINQLLSIVKLKLTATENSLNKKLPAQQLKELNVAGKLLDNAIGELRKVSKNLRPAALDDLGLAAALNSMIDEFKKMTGIKVTFKFKGIPKRMLPEAELHIYRIVQESLHNIERHSKANMASISIYTKDKDICVKIKDNGKGFVPPKSRLLNGKFGLIGMKERAESLGGTFAVISSEGKGTQITVSLPLVKQQLV